MSEIGFRSVGTGSEIGANCYVLNMDGHQIILDCGIHPKKEGPEALPDLDAIKEPPTAVLVSHGHIDHCGGVPRLLKMFPTTDCFATRPTVGIMDRMLHNSVSVMGLLAKERGIGGYPLYSHRDVDNVIRRSYGIPYGQEFALTPGCPIRIRLLNSGHALGSASILVKAPGHTVLYTGDLCMADHELLPGMPPITNCPRIDTMIVESTRGAHPHDPDHTFENKVAEFARETTKVLDQGGCVLVPCFALGRTQEMLNIVTRLMMQNRLPRVPVFASGLGRALYEVYMRYTDLLRPEANLRPLADFDRMGDVWDRRVRKDVLKKPCIICATSGMMVENTPSSILAQELVTDERNAIFFAGYLDPDTLGYKVLHSKPGDQLAFEYKGSPVTIKTANMKRFGFSAHASREDLCQLIKDCNPRNVIFVHGDAEAVQWMHDNAEGSFERHIPQADLPIYVGA